MDVATITISKEEAETAIANYRSLVKERRTEEDEATLAAYRAVNNGGQLIDLASAMRTAGVRDEYPVLACSRADEHLCEVKIYTDGHATFIGMKQRERDHRSRLRRVALPTGTFPEFNGFLHRGETLVPTVPPHLRPRARLSNYHILWEVEEWRRSADRDPILLKHVRGLLFVVLAAWELTEVERHVLEALRAE